jgi:hypothetical protein
MKNRAEILTANQMLPKLSGRVLLINPPVVDSRYPWISWNQPLDLLKLATYLQQNNGCEIKLFDFMLPLESGVVPRSRSKIYDELPNGEQVRWQFGQSSSEFEDFLDHLISSKWIPQFVWITSLTSFWWQTIPSVAGLVKNKLRIPVVILSGNYARLETNHAQQFCPNIDIIVKDSIDMDKISSNISLYEERKPKFRALDIRSSNTIDEISESIKKGITHFVFFNENVFEDFENKLKPILEEIRNQKWKLHFHGICGIEIKDFPIDYTNLLVDAHFNELHFEPGLNPDGTLNESVYIEVMKSYEKVGVVNKRGGGWESISQYFSGFMWIGKPNENIDVLVWNALKTQQLVGMVIPKPYSPLPYSKDYDVLVSATDWIEPEDLSPHRLPFSKINSIPRSEYEHLFRLTALLNNKVRSHTFDFIGHTYLVKVIKDSLVEQKWNIQK